MADIDKNAVAVALVVGLGLLALLFAGQAWTYAARVVGRAVAGAVQILFAVGIAYAAYQLYAGWNAAEDTDTIEDNSSIDAADLDATDKYLNDELSEQDLEREIEQELEEMSD